MQRFFHTRMWVLFGFFLLSFSSYSCHSSEGGGRGKTDTLPVTAALPTLRPEEIQKYNALFTAFFKDTLTDRTFSGGILIAKSGTVVYERYSGWANPKTKDSLNAGTALQLASTSKTFTAVGVLKLVEEGKIALNDVVTKFFPLFPYTNVTVKMLLNHRSGLPNYLYYMEDMGWNRKQTATNQDVLNTLINWHPPVAYKADTKFNYCNTNYVLLALIIEKVTGIPYPQYMKQTLFEPLGMTDTYVKTKADSAAAASSYKANGSLWQLDHTDGPYGDKNIYSTPRDLLKWDQALYSGAALGKAMQDSAFTPYSNERPSVHNYGLGWRLLLLHNGKKVIYHNGRWHGFNTAFARLRDEQATIIILSNKYNPGVYRIARRLYDFFGNYSDGAEEKSEE